MKTCPRCGEDFDPASARRKIEHIYGEDVYDDYYPTEKDEVCAQCAILEISADYEVGGEVLEELGSGWDDD